MISKNLLKKTTKDNYKFWLGITAGLALMLVLLMLAANSFSNGRGGGGAGESEGGVGGHILQQYYTMFAMLLPMIYIVMTGNKLIAAQVDKGSMACVMSKPIKRNEVSITQAAYLIGSIVAMFTFITITGLIMIAATGVDIEIGSFLLLNLGIICFHIAISGISFLASCIFNLSGKSLLLGAGLPVMFFIFNMLAGFSGLAEIMELFKYLTINSFYNFSDIMAGSLNMIWQFLLLFGIGAGCYVGGVLYFKKKDLPL